MSSPLLGQPAGLSPDILEHSSLHGTQDEQWSDIPNTLDTDDEQGSNREAFDGQDDLTIRPPKISTNKPDEVNSPSPTVPSPTTTQEMPRGEMEVDSVSVHSLPVVQVTEPTSPTVPTTSRSTTSSFPASPTTSLAPTASSLDRRNRQRTVLDVRASNRISGFFSNLIHRRDPPPSATREQAQSPTPPKDSSRASSPLPSRASTPPPALPAPALADLGLSLLSITSHLSPSHFSSPPSSGAFLHPHYLLLCHAQGLDVLSLVSPPAPQPYSLIRRVPFKSVVVMEHRGVLVAIAGRRDGVRVYALEEVRRAVEWRVEMEVKREREKARREEVKKALMASHEAREKRPASEKDTKARILPLFPSNANAKSKPNRRATVSVGSPSTPAQRTPTVRRPKTPPPQLPPTGPPPAYSARSRSNSSVPIDTNTSRARTTSVNDVLAGTLHRRPQFGEDGNYQRNDMKSDWASSDDEAIDPITAPSGSQALDERTSSANALSTPGQASTSDAATHLEVPPLPRSLTSASMQPRRSRPANLDLSLSRANATTDAIPTTAPPSPTPTLLTLRQTLMTSPGSIGAGSTRPNVNAEHSEAPHSVAEEVDADGDEEEDGDGEVVPSSPTTPTRERISLAEALMESRLPGLAPVGTAQPQEAILLGTTDSDVPASPRTSDSFSTRTRRSMGDQSTRRRRRWSVLDGIFTPGSSQPSVPAVPERPLVSRHNEMETSSQPEIRERQPSVLSRSHSTREPAAAVNSRERPNTVERPSTAPGLNAGNSAFAAPVSSAASTLSQPSSASRFLPRIITNAFGRRSEDQPLSPRNPEMDGRKSSAAPVAVQAPAPKLEYVKLPGTKGSIMVKAVETAKKSFLAILCGENGEKVELFAGTYRTALGLSRTFILPDSPRSLELQLQGDDLVEVFLVFSQNVFGLEPATVRVREVRIGRAERRAARRRLRETQQVTDSVDGDAAPADEDTTVNVSIAVTIASSSPNITEDSHQLSPLPSPAPGTLHPADTPSNTMETASTLLNSTNADELITLAAAQMSPYTTFQQLTFAPNFPLATIADEYIIPPTYPSFLEYRSQYEPEVEGTNNVDLSQVQFSPPGLPAPVVSPPSLWYYRDPKGIVHGPWKANIMQTWYKDGLLPPDLPVRREEDEEYTPLKELRLQCLDPMFPFRSSPPPPSPAPIPAQQLPFVDPAKPLLPPMSLLSQPKHFGPPALFFSSRGGHSTTIVDARGRSVLRGRFVWSPDEDDEDETNSGGARLGDVKRLEAFDVEDRAVLVAMRQGGLEVVDFGDALLLPADHSRTLFPHFHPPSSSVNRRGAYIWRIGAPISASSSSSSLPSLPPRLPHRFHGKKQSIGVVKSPGRSDLSTSGDPDQEHRDEVLFLGRKDNEVYICEKRPGSFRILRLSPNLP